MNAKRETGGELAAVWEELGRLRERVDGRDGAAGWSVEDFRAYRKLASLTERQLMATMLVLEGASNGEIGEVMGGGENAAKQVIRLVYGKLGVSKRVEMAGFERVIAKIDDEHWRDMAGFEKRWAERALVEIRGRRP